MRRIIDSGMTVLLLLLMAYQTTGETVHEWIGVGMTVLVIIHQILNRRWYRALFKGRYNAYRTATTAVNGLLLLSFLLTALSGMAMSSHAVPFLHGMIPVSFARQIHLAMSHWSFVLMGVHLGFHVPAMTAGINIDIRKKRLLSVVFCCIAGAGLYFFLLNNLAEYMFFKTAFVFLDYEKAGVLVLLENILMLLFWVFAGNLAAVLCRKKN